MRWQVAIGGDRNAMRVPVMGDGLRHWSFGLFDCFADLSTCTYDSHPLPIATCSIISWLIGDSRPPGNDLSLLYLLAEPAAVYPSRDTRRALSREI